MREASAFRKRLVIIFPSAFAFLSTTVTVGIYTPHQFFLLIFIKTPYQFSCVVPCLCIIPHSTQPSLMHLSAGVFYISSSVGSASLSPPCPPAHGDVGMQRGATPSWQHHQSVPLRSSSCLGGAITRASRVGCAGVIRGCLPLSRPLLPPTNGTSRRGTLPAWRAPLAPGHHDETLPGHGCAG